ncbi:uncharacterized protein [Henckelia pumila]|uniref:uncharacterized protein isoform X2 n=2 Tax=Henckelia pumila TaxID=405737 RepID=UPI003C6E3AD2
MHVVWPKLQFLPANIYTENTCMFSNLNANDVQGMTDCISQMLERLCISDVYYQLVEHSAVDSGKERDSCDRIFGNLSASDACFANVTADSGCNTSFGLNGDISEKVTSKEKDKYHTSVEKITRRVLLMKLADGRHHKRVMDNKVSSNFSMKEQNLSVILPSQRQVMEAMADPKSFNCVWSLCPMTNFRKKRSQTRSRKTQFSGMHEEMKHLEPQGCTFSLTWSVKHKKKRSNVSARSCDLSNLCLVPKAFPLKALSVVS